jgi:hypothetical protein
MIPNIPNQSADKGGVNNVWPRPGLQPLLHMAPSPRMRLSLFLSVVILCSGCVAPEDFGGARKPAHSVDDFTGVTTDSISTTPIGGLSSELKSPARISFTLSREQEKQANSRHFLTVHYNGLSTSHGGAGWLFIKAGESLSFLIDGETFPLSSTEGSERFREVVNGTVRETAKYPLPISIAERIAKAALVKVRLTGTSYFLDKTLNESNKRTFAEFVEKLSGDAHP